MPNPTSPPLKIRKRFGLPIFIEECFPGMKPVYSHGYPTSHGSSGSHSSHYPPLNQRSASSPLPVLEAELIDGEWVRGEGGIFVRKPDSSASPVVAETRQPPVAANNVIDFPSAGLKLRMSGVSARKEAVDMGYGIGAVVMTVAGDEKNPMTWGFVVNISDALREGAVSPIGVKWMLRKTEETLWYHKNALTLIHKAKSPTEIIRDSLAS